MPTWEELHKKAEDDYKAALGRILLVTYVDGYVGDDLRQFTLEPPARMRVIQTAPGDLRHSVDDWLDPYWDLELIDYHPALREARSFWTYGPSYRKNGDVQATSEWTFEDHKQPQEG